MTSNQTPERVVGLAYEPAQGLPRVVLKGVGPMGELLRREFLKEHPAHRVIRNDQLAESLFRLPMDAQISPGLYELVALVLVYVFSVEARLKEVAGA